MEKLKDPEKAVRIAAMLSLGRLGQGNSQVQEALSRFCQDSDPDTRLNAVVSLASLGKTDQDSMPLLFQALVSEESATSRAAGRALGTLGAKEPQQVLPGILKILDGAQWPASGNALRVLKQMKAQAAPALATVVKLYDNADSIGRSDVLEAVIAIDSTGDQALPILLKAVQDPDAKDRRDALIGLMRFRSRVDLIIGPVSEALKDSDPENKLLAIGIIRGLGQPGRPSLPGLVAAASSDPDLRVRSAALNALVSYRPLPQEAFDALEAFLKDGDSRVRSAAVNALRAVGQDYPEQTTAMLKAALETEKNGASRKLIESVLQSVAKAKDSKPGDRTDSQKTATEMTNNK